ncbi:MAG: YIP1 family protein [Bacillota bacterium]
MSVARHCSTGISRLLVMLVLLVNVLLVLTTASVQAVVPYSSYVYDEWADDVPAPQAYVPKAEISGRDLGVGDFKAPMDICVGPDGAIYILDTGNNRIVHLTSDWQVVRVIQSFDRGDAEDRFRNPEGLAISADGDIYVADTGNGRVLHLDSSAVLVKEINDPKDDGSGVIPQGFVFRPAKVGVDGVGRVFVISKGMYEGLMEFDSNGNFRGFMGAPRVTPTAADIFWSKVATREQRERQSLFLPTEFSAIDVDSRGFIFVTKQGTAASPTTPHVVSALKGQGKDAIMKLNPGGSDVLIRKGFFPPFGDVAFSRYPGVTAVGPSYFRDIVSRENDIFSVLDSNRGRVFTYDGNGKLLYVFGTIGSQTGALLGPVALDCVGDDIVIVDSLKNVISVYAPTIYAKRIHAAILLFEKGFYDAAEAMWKSVLSLNANYELAYAGVGSARLLKEDYVNAMRYFKLGADRDGYSKAYRKYREELVDRYFGIGASVIVIAVLLIYLVVRSGVVARAVDRIKTWASGSGSGKALLRELAFAFFVLFHPFDGFWQIKHEKKASVRSACIVLALVIATYVGVQQYTAFIFNPHDVQQVNFLSEAFTVQVPFGLWCCVSWAVTTLMDGEGTIKDIFISSAYALTPIIVVYIPLTALSHVLVQEEAAFYQLFQVLGAGWALVWLFLATMIVHDYSFGKTAGGIAITVVGMAFALFCALVFYDIIGAFTGFVSGIYREIVFRM